MNQVERTQDMLDFIENGVTAFHVIRNIESYLDGAGFQKLSETNAWNLTQNGRYYVTRNDSSIIAFCIPTAPFHGYQIIASHSDSPSFKLKDVEKLTSGAYSKLNVERYGGMIMSTWFDRPLSVAGRVMVRTGNGVKTVLYNAERNLVSIPNLAIHMNRDVNTGHNIDVQKELMPVLGSKDVSLLELVAADLQISTEDILGTDLFLYNRETGTIWGAEEEFCSAPRLDDQQCVYGSLQGFLSVADEYDEIHPTVSDNVPVFAVFDNEEVGSSTKQGADSSFLQDTLYRINECMGRTSEQYNMTIANSFMISADNAHGIHPNYAEKADMANYPVLNEGVVIKFNANQKYTTDAVSAAVLRTICEKADVPVQCFANHSNIVGGSTLGNIANTHVSMNTVDIGLAQWAMHSAYETAGVADTEYLVKLSDAFYRSTITRVDSEYIVR